MYKNTDLIVFAIKFRLSIVANTVSADYIGKCEYDFAKKTVFDDTILVIKIQSADTILISGMHGFASKEILSIQFHYQKSKILF